MSRSRALIAAVLLQLTLVGLYVAVERHHDAQAPFRWEPLDEPAPPLALTREGQPVALPVGPHLVHFWATWCAPCRRELPALIAAARRADVPLLAVTAEPWPTVERFFEGDVPAAVVQDIGGAGVAEWRVSALPDTFAVSDGGLTARIGGERDWTTDGAGRFLDDLGR